MSTAATLDAVLKELYRDEYQVVTYQKRPLLGMLPKFEGFTGRNLRLPLRYGNAMGRSATFTTAQGNITASKYEDFVLTRVKDYGIHTLDTEGLEAADGGEGSFVDGLEEEINSILDAVADSLEGALFRDGTGAIGQISAGSTVASASITLANLNDVTNFEPGMQLVASATAGGTLRTSGATETILSINRTTAVLTSTSATWDAVILAIAASDFLHCEGDVNLKVKGVTAWVPSSSPGATSFFSVDRTTDTVRLGGCRHDGSTAGTVEEALIDGQAVCGREGGAVDVMLVNNADYRRLLKTTGSRVQYPRGSMSAKSSTGEVGWINFGSLKIQGDYGIMDVIPANKCPQGYALGLQLDTWVLATMGKCPKIIMNDGLRVLRSGSADGVEIRTGYKGQLGCRAPGYNVNITLPSA